MKKSFILFYLLILVLHLITGELGYEFIAALTKPALLTSLLLFFGLTTSNYGFSKFSIFIVLALVFSLAGDVFLMLTDRPGDFFLYGLGAFLIAHIFYTAAFTITYLQDHEIALIKRQGWVMVLIVGYGYLFFMQLRDHLGEMVGPVILYVAVITLMLLIATNRFKRVSSESFKLIFFGALLFVASDSILSWNMFVDDIQYSHVLVMSTYGIAQLLITLGAIKQVEESV